MSHDALSHLVQRTLQPEPAVGPRLPSRYEGRRGGPDTEIEQDVEVTSPPAAYRPSANAEKLASESPRADASYEETGAAEPDQAHDDSPAERLAASAPRAIDEQATVATTRQPSARTSQEPDQHQAGVSRAAVTIDLDRTAAPPGKQPPSAEHVRPVEPLRVGQQHTNDPIPRAAPLAPATVVIPDEPPRPDPESVVHITIGRVEVRGAPSSTPSRPPQQLPERRVMSLEEYLDRRGRGSSP